MSRNKKLGKGLEALLGSSSVKRRAAPMAIFELPVSELVQGQSQPRQSIDDDSLTDLVASIRQEGVLQPVLVRPLTGSQAGAGFVSHEIVAGERRWRAARLAGLDTVPVVIRELDDQSALAIALIENLQREDLNAVEVAQSLLRLTEEFGLTHQQAAECIGLSRSSVSNLLRLLELDYPARESLAAGRMSMGHARALLAVDSQQQMLLTKRIEVDGLSVRQVEALVADLLAPPPADLPKKPGATVDAQTRWLQKQLTKEAGLQVRFKNRSDGGHALNIGFENLEQLQLALRKIYSLIGWVRDTAGPRQRDKDS